MGEESKQTPKLQIDADWKASAQAEKDRLAEQEKARAPRRDAALPKASFTTLMDMLASQAIMSLGAMADRNGRVIIDPAGAKFSIDLLAVLEEKTKSNLSKEESGHLGQVLHELRTRFVQVMQLVAAQEGADGAEVGENEPNDATTPAVDTATPASPTRNRIITD